MRGPGLRLKNDVRRLWRCPRCGTERRVPATEVAVCCVCQPARPQMQLVEPQRFVRPAAIPLPPYIDCEELLGPDDPSSAAATVVDSAEAVAVIDVTLEVISEEILPAQVEDPTSDSAGEDDVNL